MTPTLLSPPRHGNDPSPDRRLRVGYASLDFREHPVAFFIEPVLAHHDAGQVEVFCYAELPVLDPTTARLRSLAHGWRPTFGLPDEEVAEQVRADGIDVLVDLAGHTAGHRLPVFARKPAPVQATYLGYPNTPGLKAMDYRLTDALADPPGMTEGYHVERLWRLPGCFLCYRPRPDGPAVGTSPPVASGHITFGSSIVLAKVTPHDRTALGEVLRAVPGSRLLLKARALERSGAPAAVQQRFAGQGVEMERLVFSGWERSDAGHLATYGRWTWRWTRSPTTARRRPAKPCGWACRWSAWPATGTPPAWASACWLPWGCRNWWPRPPRATSASPAAWPRSEQAIGRPTLGVAGEDACLALV